MTREEELGIIIDGIENLDNVAMETARKKWNSIAKPLHSLGKLEEHIIRIAGITGNAEVELKNRALIAMCADNGVVEEGVTQTGQEVTAIVAENFLEGATSAAIMCQSAEVDLFPIDIGMVRDTRVPNYKVAYGTKNMVKEPAMTREEALQAILTGVHLVKEKKEAGYQILATGEMGIGNTTTSSAMTAVYLGLDVETVTGRGAGLSSHGLQRKIHAIKQAIAVNQPDPEDPLDVLAKVGGLDIAGMCGLFLGGAAQQMPVIMDGFISQVAALTAMRLVPECADYILASHVSEEPGANILLKALEKDAFLTCGMRLGEGSGAVALFPILDFASDIYHKMSTFVQADIVEYQPLD